MYHCERCNKPATVHLTEISGGKRVEIHLCDACAQEAGYVQQAHVPINQLLNQFLQAHAQVNQQPAEKCPDCGMTWQEFKDTGLLGCPKDYDIFESQLRGVIERAQNGATHHAGKTPGIDAQSSGTQTTGPGRQAELLKLRKELARAIEDESYERAATLRDQIKTLEGN